MSLNNSEATSFSTAVLPLLLFQCLKKGDIVYHLNVSTGVRLLLFSSLIDVLIISLDLIHYKMSNNVNALSLED